MALSTCINAVPLGSSWRAPASYLGLLSYQPRPLPAFFHSARHAEQPELDKRQKHFRLEPDTRCIVSKISTGMAPCTMGVPQAEKGFPPLKKSWHGCELAKDEISSQMHSTGYVSQ